MKAVQRRTIGWGLSVVSGLAWAVGVAPMARADAFEHYVMVERFTLPAGAGPFDFAADGRVLALIGADLYEEDAPGSRTFTLRGTLPDADIASFGAAFLRMSPDGTKIAVGNNGGTAFSAAVEQTVARGRYAGGAGDARPLRRPARPVPVRMTALGRTVVVGAATVAGSGAFEVGVFDVQTLTGQWFAANHFDAEWIDNRHLAVTAGDFVNPSVVTALDTQSADSANPVNPVIIQNVGGASGGITFDTSGNLYTANGFATSGPSGTGAVKAFPQADWSAALSGGMPPDFENDGTLIIDILSGSPLAFDAEGNLAIGGGDSFGGGEVDFVALVRAAAIAEALDGGGPVDPGDAQRVRRLDPDKLSGSNFYSVALNGATGELFQQDGAVYVWRDLTGAPAVSTWGLAIMGLLLLTAGTLAVHRRIGAPCS